MTCTICTKHGKRGETRNLKNKHLFITRCNNFLSSAISDHEKSKGHLNNTYVYICPIHVDWYGIKITSFQKFLLKVFRSGRKLVDPAETDIV
jgi:hypothetical protein